MSPARRLTPFVVLTILLSLSALGPVFDGAGWVPATLLVVAAALAGASLGRFTRVPRPLVPIVGLAAMVLMITTVFAWDTAIAHVLPWRGAVRALADLARAGSDDITNYPTPIQPRTGVVLLTAAGVGLVALLIDTLAITFRRVALTGLPLLALYTVPAAVVRGGVGVVPFLLGAAGWLALLAADSRERVGLWGRQLGRGRRAATGADHVDGRPGPRRVPTSLGASARRVGAVALGLAVAVPALMPSLAEGLIQANGSGGPALFGGSGGSAGGTSLSLLADLRADLVRKDNPEVLRYRTSDDTGLGYLRVQTLDQFHGDTWVPSARPGPSRRQPLDAGLDQPISPWVPTTALETQIEVADLRQSQLPLPLTSTGVTGLSGQWWVDGSNETVFSTTSDTKGKKYTAVSLRPELTPDSLRQTNQDESMRRYLQLPAAGLSPLVLTDAERHTQGADTDYDKAVMLQAWLRSPEFSYSDSAPASDGSTSSIQQFLIDKSGYCTHFATTMAVMARALGIPARVNIGFTGGQPDGSGWYSVRLHDAHAWPELYFAGYGWVSFEPTPAARTGAAPAITDPTAVTPTTEPVYPTAAPGASSTATPTGKAADKGNDPRNRGNDSAGVGPSGSGVAWGKIAAVLLVIAVVLLPHGMAMTRRRWRWARADTSLARAEAAWAELGEALSDLRLPWSDTETPRQARARLERQHRLDAESAEALTRVVRAVELARYAPGAADVSTLRRDVRVVTGTITRSLSERTRTRTWLLPRSAWLLVGDLAAAGSQWWNRAANRLATAARRGDAPSAPRRVA